MISVHLPNTSNIGDEVGSPALYFDGFEGRYHMDDFPIADMTVFGGGCIAKEASKKSYDITGKKVAWSIGDSARYSDKLDNDVDYSNFDLVGLRDYPTKGNYDWIPCPSCMSPLFDNIKEPTKRVIHYGHKKISPSVGLNNDCMDFEKVIEYLSQGETIVTSSYHGMVWGTWLGRKVEVLPFGSKFFGWPYEWGKVHDNSLKEARSLNTEFYKKVLRLRGDNG